MSGVHKDVHNVGSLKTSIVIICMHYIEIQDSCTQSTFRRSDTALCSNFLWCSCGPRVRAIKRKSIYFNSGLVFPIIKIEYVIIKRHMINKHLFFSAGSLEKENTKMKIIILAILLRLTKASQPLEIDFLLLSSSRSFIFSSPSLKLQMNSFVFLQISIIGCKIPIIKFIR
ncbi:unnamed protein product [Moneuplotes crassus]|uniref:Uncharacterized protein n=1 Tax=Euplotes crassus TaxID=5936 RepID=A0AAD2DAV8_EUPCR|nr:unnamed protein product [Moneuplotes crassus]